jgi:hypothetical protein
MKRIFRKIATVAGSAVMLGATMGSAFAWQESFVEDGAAVVYGASSMDSAAASSIVSNLNSYYAADTVTSLEGGESITEDEIALDADLGSIGDFATAITDSEIDSLLDTSISWDNDTVDDDYDVHEQILVGADAGTVYFITTSDDEDLEGPALANDKGLEYRLVLEEPFVGVDSDDDTTDDLYLEVLGTSYEIQSIPSASSIKVVTSEQVALSVGESVTVDGVTLTVEDIFDGSVQINGEIVSETGGSEKVDGIRVDVEAVGYHDNSPETSSAVLRVGEDLSETFEDGDAYIGEDEDEPEWVWSISGLTGANGYVGVKYDMKQLDAEDDVIYEGEGYMFPENFAELTFDSVTDVEYKNVEVSFDDSMDLYNATEDIDYSVADAPVVVLEADDDDAFTIGTVETSALYFRYLDNSSVAADGSTTYASGAVEVYAKDVDGDFDGASNEPRLADTVELTAGTGADNVATFTYDDTNLVIGVNVTSYAVTLNVGNVGASLGTQALADGDFDYLGGAEDAASTDVTLDGTSIGNKDQDMMDSRGLIVEDVENNADDDIVSIQVPNEDMEATVSLTVGGSASSSSEEGILSLTDDEVSQASGMNLVVVGGSAINSVAAELLGGAYSEADFTAATGVAAGEAMIESFSYNGATALLVAGYNKEDTTMATTYLLNEVDDVSDVALKVTSTTEATALAA